MLGVKLEDLVVGTVGFFGGLVFVGFPGVYIGCVCVF